MPSSRDIQRRVERLEQTNRSEQPRFVFNIRTLIALFGEDFVPGPQPQGENPNHGEHAITPDRR